MNIMTKVFDSPCIVKQRPSNIFLNFFLNQVQNKTYYSIATEPLKMIGN